MKKLLFVLLMGLLCVGRSEAANPTRGAKGVGAINYTTTASSMSIVGPVVVYSVYMSTGATGDFVALYDTNTLTGITAGGTTGAGYKTRCMAGSTIATTSCNYDPPLQFNAGFGGVLSTANDAAIVIYEKGRITQGY